MAYADGANDVNRSIWWYGLGDNGAISDVIKYLSFDCFIGLAHANLARVPPRRVLPCVTILPHVKQPLTPQNTVYSWVAEADGAIFMSIVQYIVSHLIVALALTSRMRINIPRVPPRVI